MLHVLTLAHCIYLHVVYVRCFAACIHRDAHDACLARNISPCVQGIKITDADSKKKAIKVLKAEQAMREMEIDSDASDSGSDVEMK